MVCIGRPRDAGTGPELRTPGAAAQTRIVSKARIRLNSRKSVRSFKGIIYVDISEFESYMPSHAVRSLWLIYGTSKNAGKNPARVACAPVVLREGARKRSISKLEGIVLKQIESALKGNEKAALATLKMAAQVGLLEAPEGAGETPTLSASEREMVNELVLQRTKRRRSKSRR